MSRRSSAVLTLQRIILKSKRSVSERKNMSGKIEKIPCTFIIRNSRFVCEVLLLSYELVSVINIFSDTFQQSYSDKQNYFLHNERKTVIIKVNYNYYIKKKSSRIL